jgi:CTD kinase subunit alpha
LHRLQTLEGDWHEFETKALRKENEKKDKEARRALQKEASAAKDKEKKRAPEGDNTEREAKRQHTEALAAEVSKDMAQPITAK